MILVVLALGGAQIATSVNAPATPAGASTSQTMPVPKSEDGFTVGVDTIATITAKLGTPNSTESASDGTTTIRYMAIRTKVKGASFIPIVGLFAGGAKGKSSTKTFTFDAAGVLKSYGSSKFETECKAFGGCR